MCQMELIPITTNQTHPSASSSHSDYQNSNHFGDTAFYKKMLAHGRTEILTMD